MYLISDKKKKLLVINSLYSHKFLIDSNVPKSSYVSTYIYKSSFILFRNIAKNSTTYKILCDTCQHVSVQKQIFTNFPKTTIDVTKLVVEERFA